MVFLRKLTYTVLAAMILTIMPACSAAEQTGNTVSSAGPDITSVSQSVSAESSAIAAQTTPTQPRPFTPVREGVIPIDSSAVYTSRGENLGWQKYIYTFGEKNTGKQHVSYDVTPLGEKLDASVNFADYDVNVRGFENLAILVRMNTYGYFDARNGASMDAVNKVYYLANQTFHIDVYADMLKKNFTVYITPQGGEKTLLVENATFRNSASAYTNDLGKMAIISFQENEKLRVENVTLGTWE